ncbi:alanine--tRNA ligase-related protein [Gordonia sp. DT30]|uniref:alanine--tRNA ligase-related protein n=1 Tax=unclassified Gordonia (in: high G+C Gram-positive bacteria) TaxID=2657482 RepID=UPI003CF6D854
MGEIRAGFLRYMTDRGHAVIDRAPLVLRDDPTTLFTGSGMQPLVPYLMGADHPGGTQVADVQPCLRSQDIDEVGDNRHTTFFEMLGNWSFGSYFKREQIEALWGLLVDVVGLDPERLYVSVYSGDFELGIPRDDDSADIWAELFERAGIATDRTVLDTEERADSVGSQGAHICYYRDKNWWSRAGGPADMPVGEPGGPDTEVFYHFPQVPHDTAYGDHPHPNSDGGQYMEIGNSVFMQFAKDVGGLRPLTRRNVDFGGGLERIAAASIDSPDVYRVSTLWPIICGIETLSGTRYEAQTQTMRIIADHLRGAVFLIADGIVPAAKEHGYVLRRLLRRAIRFAHGLGLTDGVTAELAAIVIDIYAAAYPDVAAQREHIMQVLGKEERSFRRTLGKGLRELRRLGKESRPITGADFFTLYDRYGFPVELSSEEAVTRGLDISPDWRTDFDAHVREQRERSRSGSRLGVH